MSGGCGTRKMSTRDREMKEMNIKKKKKKIDIFFFFQAEDGIRDISV